MEAPFIQTFNLHKKFQMGTSIVQALDGVDLSIEENTFSVIMGPSGSGKSTLLYLLGGLDRPSSGRIKIDNHFIETMDENQLAKYRRETIGFIFQSFNLIASMTALDNVSFPLLFSGIPHRKRTQKAEGVLLKVGLSDRVYHRPIELSGGQQQRVAIARALISNPKLVLADEPTGNLDSASGANIMQLLSDLHRDGHTVIVVSHDPRISRYATHQYYILDGRIVSEDAYQSSISTDFEPV